MKAIQYTNQASKTILHLLYCTCTHDIIVNSKRASGVDDFLYVFFIEFSRFFIADSSFVKGLKEQIKINKQAYIDIKKSIYNTILIENKNAFLDFFNTNNSNKISSFSKANRFERSEIAN